MPDAPTRFILTPVGSAGDVHPLIGVGRELRKRGHDVVLITSGKFRDAVERCGLTFVEHGTAEQFDQITQNKNLWHPRKGLKVVMRMHAEHMRGLYTHIEQQYQPGRSVLVGHTIAFGARVFEDKHDCPAVTLHLAPSVFRGDYQQPVHTPGLDISAWPRWSKRGLWSLIDRVFADPAIAPALNRWRRELGLEAIRHPFRQWIHSPRRVIAMFPHWFAPPQPDWPKQAHYTGFPLFDEAGHHELHPHLDAFIKADAPPIVFTPGSANSQAGRFFAAAVEATKRLRRRGLLVTPYRDQLPAERDTHVMHVPYAPFSELLPRCAAIVHHGGIGTCAQGLAAGVPQLIMPMGFDQPDNAARLKRLGVGDWLTPRRFTPPNLTRMLRRLVESPHVRVACEECATRIRDATPIEQTCDLIEQMAADRGQRSEVRGQKSEVRSQR